MKSFPIILVFFLVYLFLILPHMNDPITYDELFGVIPAETLINTGKPLVLSGGLATFSPLLSIHIQTVFYRMFGVSNWSSRLLGVCCIFFQLLIFSFLGKIVIQSPRERRIFLLTCCFLFITNPLTLQGSLMPASEDTLIFPFWLSLFALFFIHYEKEGGIKKIIILGLIYSVSIWLRPTNLPLIPGAMILYFLSKKSFRGILNSLLISIIGLTVFLVAWKAYAAAAGLDFSGPMKWSSHAFIANLAPKVLNSPLTGLAVNGVRFTLWIGLFSLLLWAFVCLRKVDDYRKCRSIEPVSFLLFFSFLLGIGYFLIGGMSFGLPRYHYALLPAMSIVCAFVLKDVLLKVSRKDLFVYGGITAILSLFYYFVVGDLIYIINFSLREAAVTFPYQTESVLCYFSFKFLLYLAPTAGCFMMVWRRNDSRNVFKKIVLALLILICASNISLDYLHSRADYLLRNCYGEKGTEKLLEYLNENTKLGDTLLATNDIIYYIRDKKIPYLSTKFWYELDCVLKAVRQPSVKFIVYSIGHNNIQQFREVISHREFISELKEHFVFQEIGSYKVWRRKEL